MVRILARDELDAMIRSGRARVRASRTAMEQIGTTGRHREAETTARICRFTHQAVEIEPRAPRFRAQGTIALRIERSGRQRLIDSRCDGARLRHEPHDRNTCATSAASSRRVAQTPAALYENLSVKGRIRPFISIYLFRRPFFTS